jgi:uroporphyrin-III C-methyltransferase
LQACDTVVYDALIDEEILSQAPAAAEKISVGKRAGHHSMAQEEINQLLINLAQQGRRVVRLKGGDPYVFGRGGEEAMALAQAGICYEVIPGISSALAVPLEAGIPVTHRAVSRSVHIITAHTAEDLLPENLACLGALEGTLVFLMGLGRLEELARALIQAGKDPATPAAVLSGGNAAVPARVTGPLAQIAALAVQQGVQAPAIILVGPTAAMDLRSPQSAIGMQ